jgi:hypothetical protein
MQRGALPLRVAMWLAIAAAVLAGSASALAAASSNPVIQDCLNHPAGLTGHYSVAQLNHALQVMPAETKEYTDCPDVINRARLAALHGLKGGGGGSGGSGSFLPTPVLIVLIIVILAGVTFGALAVRRRRGLGESGGPAAGPGS